MIQKYPREERADCVVDASVGIKLFYPIPPLPPQREDP